MKSNTRVVLTYALGGLLLLAALVGLGALLILQRIHIGEAALRARLIERSGWLENIRRGVFDSGAVASDYCAQPNGPDAPALLTRLRQVEDATREVLERYSGSVQGHDSTAAELRGEVLAYWKLLDLMSEMAGRRKTAALDTYFQHRVAQRRESMSRIEADISTAIDREIRLGETDLSNMYAAFRSGLILELALVIGAGLFLSVIAIRRIERLEAEAGALSARVLSAQEQERRAIARELHDDIAQALSGILLDAGHAASLTENDAVLERLKSIAGAADKAVDDVRRIALSLRPSMLDDLGLVPALEWQAREISNRTGLDVEVNADETAGELSETLRTCIYRVAQEALRNCARHSQAQHVRVGLEKSGRSVALRVEDDGRGFAPQRERGLGLLGIEERVRQLGGRLGVHSDPGKGTVLTAELPI